MKNKTLIYIFFFFYLCSQAIAEELNIKSKKITINKENNLTVFSDDVIAKDKVGNTLKTNFAEYNKNEDVLITKNETSIVTLENYIINGKNIIFDNKNRIIFSKNSATLKSPDNKLIYLEEFEYSLKNNFLKSIGKIKLVDNNKNILEFAQIYVDIASKEIVGTDAKVFLNDNQFKINSSNDPRIFSNTVKIKNNKTEFSKSVFTMCGYRENKKCPPWELRADKMTHDDISKTIYYDNTVLKIYNVPIFYFPKIFHPDPTVERRSGFLPPTLNDSKNLGTSLKIPYYWAISKDRDFTFTPKIFTSENPIFLGEYRRAFTDSNLIFDFGFTEGYKKTDAKKKSGDKMHFFSDFTKIFKNNNFENSLSVKLQNVNNRKYLKLYNIDTPLVNSKTDTLENSIKFNHQTDDLHLGFNSSVYRTLKDDYNDKYEYILPEILLDKNLISDFEIGEIDLQSNFKVHNYDTNKLSKFLTNDIFWKKNKDTIVPGINSQLSAQLKNVNYEISNIDGYKEDHTNELHGAFGYLLEADFEKNNFNEEINHSLTPKIFLRYAPGQMRDQKNGSRLNSKKAFNLERLEDKNNFETGLSASIGLDYEMESSNKKLDFSLAQVINDRNNNKMPFKSSLDKRFSDVVGETNYQILDQNLTMNYNFSLDQNYKELNYNELGLNFNYNLFNFDLKYLQEKNHIGNNEYFKAKMNLFKKDNFTLSAETKRNILTNSTDYYDLSYEYLNDCLRAGLVYRREFYNDSELESENSLMFKITLSPFGQINTPSFE